MRNAFPGAVPEIPVSDISKATAYYQSSLGFNGIGPAISFSPFSLLGEGLGMRACESKEAIFLFVLRERRVAFKDKNINRVDAQ